MTEMFLERQFEPPMTPADVLEMARDATGCFGLHQVEWLGSLLSHDGRRMVCRFRAADMESARIALRQTNADLEVFWHGSVHSAPGLDEGDIASANILVERQFEDSVTLRQIQDIEDAGIWCLETRDVRFIRTYFSADQKRMICLYEAPDAESVRQAQRQAGVPFDDVWAFRFIGAADMACTSG